MLQFTPVLKKTIEVTDVALQKSVTSFLAVGASRTLLL